jgi:hypothetical protein
MSLHSRGFGGTRYKTCEIRQYILFSLKYRMENVTESENKENELRRRAAGAVGVVALSLSLRKNQPCANHPSWIVSSIESDANLIWIDAGKCAIMLRVFDQPKDQSHHHCYKSVMRNFLSSCEVSHLQSQDRNAMSILWRGKLSQNMFIGSWAAWYKSDCGSVVVRSRWFFEHIL